MHLLILMDIIVLLVVVVNNGIHICILVHAQLVKIGMEFNALMYAIMDINILLIDVFAPITCISSMENALYI